MEKINALKEWFLGPNGVILMSFLFVLSEGLAEIPSVNSNSVFQLIRSAIKAIKGKLSSQPPAPK